MTAFQRPSLYEHDLTCWPAIAVAALEAAIRSRCPAYLFHSARVSQVIRGCKEVVDLGCGPAMQLCQIAQLNLSTTFHGLDLSPEMLEKARQNVARLELSNVRLSLGDITSLDQWPAASVDGVVSTMALHHLPTLFHLRRCLRGIHRMLRAGGALYLVDFTRLKNEKTVRFFVDSMWISKLTCSTLTTNVRYVLRSTRLPLQRLFAKSYLAEVK